MHYILTITPEDIVALRSLVEEAMKRDSPFDLKHLLDVLPADAHEYVGKSIKED